MKAGQNSFRVSTSGPGTRKNSPSRLRQFQRLRLLLRAFGVAWVSTICVPSMAIAQPTAKAEMANAGAVQKVLGNVSAIRDGASIAISAGDAVREGDTISTPSGASALVQLDDGAKLLVRANTKVSLSQMTNTGASENLKHSIDLATGAIRYVTGEVGKSRPQNVRFKTPSATVGIRGTDIEIVVAPKTRSLQNPGTYVRVNTGEIELGANDGSSVTLAANEQAFAGTPGPKTRNGTRGPAARKLDAPANVFSSGELDSLIDRR